MALFGRKIIPSQEQKITLCQKKRTKNINEKTKWKDNVVLTC